MALIFTNFQSQTASHRHHFRSQYQVPLHSFVHLYRRQTNIIQHSFKTPLTDRQALTSSLLCHPSNKMVSDSKNRTAKSHKRTAKCHSRTTRSHNRTTENQPSSPFTTIRRAPYISPFNPRPASVTKSTCIHESRRSFSNSDAGTNDSTIQTCSISNTGILPADQRPLHALFDQLVGVRSGLSPRAAAEKIALLRPREGVEEWLLNDLWVCVLDFVQRGKVASWCSS